MSEISLPESAWKVRFGIRILIAHFPIQRGRLDLRSAISHLTLQSGERWCLRRQCVHKRMQSSPVLVACGAWLGEHNAFSLSNLRLIPETGDTICTASLVCRMVPRDTPDVIVTAAVAPPVCSNCGSDVAMQVCGGCRAVRYCSSGCQHEAYNSHQSVCRAIRISMMVATSDKQRNKRLAKKRRQITSDP